PLAGVSGGEWTLIVMLSLVGSAVYAISERVHWPPVGLRMKGVEVFGKAYDYTVDTVSVPATGVARVVVENHYGNARVVAGDGAEVRVSGRKTVRAYGNREADNAARAVNVSASREGDVIFVRSLQDTHAHDHVVTTDLEVVVPASVRVEGRGRRGDFDIHGVLGAVDIQSDNAGVRLSQIGGEVRVETKASDVVRASGVKGSVELRGYGQDVDLEDVGGAVTVAGNYFGELQFRNITKSVRFGGGGRGRSSEFHIASCPGTVRLNRGNLSMEDVAGPVVINARSKDVQISGFSEGLELKVERGDVELRPGRVPLPPIAATTNSGNIELVLPEKAAFELRAVAEHGSIHNEFEGALRLVEGDGGKDRRSVLAGQVGSGPSVTIQTERGDVLVRKGSLLDPPRPPRPPAPHELKIERH
ncbi:MAG TPA: DUF4097 family beta strand repeat-containing protein, partial [Bryobacteraceae bacterium]|nr:DUF4097 family beta strand repeat-containing protein [Bryobacteraceae bacterium]